MLRIKNLSVPFDCSDSLEQTAAKRLKINCAAIKKVTAAHKAIDARRYKRAPICFVYTLDVYFTADFSEKKLHRRLKNDKNIEFIIPPFAQLPNIPEKSRYKSKIRPVVAGFGPAGMFCALTLCKYGYAPIILERGRDVDKRHADIMKFWQTGELDVKSNVQFGEGGAGTFSDGKLTTRINDPLIGEVLQDFVDAGAPPEICILNKPHIGTDILRSVVKNIRKKIISLGGSVNFEDQLIDLKISDRKLISVIGESSGNIPCDALFIGIGHSARDTYEMLLKNNVAMQAKPFAVGVRIEHPQSMIDEAQYGCDAGNKILPVSDYALTWHDREKNLSCYSFCMCPGGFVVAAASEKDRLTTNGMSNYRRESGIANSALLAPVTSADFGSDVLSGIEFQRHYENAAFIAGGKNYYAPAQSVGDFLKHKHGSDSFLTEPTYRPGITPVNLHNLLPAKVAISIEQALPSFGRKIPGFDNENVLLTGLEMRSSAPCRIVRNKETYISVNTDGLYPIGEGAGYAGGIMSAAIDGIKAALSYIEK